ncbi:FAD-binding domain-containing protein [Acaromyces ingoldii]|uniref:FAD-binding domain-containing protein n=1 Tax=Acaromyces ingoldii TaxID=215250 RepID=A0A316YNF5_9BASI|nr:FAD-binding domain-containing protein [Acaromyces ingoldii]PWN90907.1 FAD-binding domain-containing protein [Acaromyces ingoldii]
MRASASSLLAAAVALQGALAMPTPDSLGLSARSSYSLDARAVSSSLKTCLSNSGASLAYASSGDAYTNEAKAENTNYAYKPAVIAQPSSVKQVAAVVKCVAAEGGKTKISPRGGGHGYAAYALGGADGFVVVDSSKLNTLSLDTNQKTVTVGMGMTLGPLAKAIGDQGYALPHGTCPTVGTAGHSLGGGWGYSSRRWGWLMDHLVSLNYVDASGTVHHSVSQSSTGQDADVWWAMRGGGSNNFGIVTSFTFALETAPAKAVNFVTTYNSNADCAQALLALQDLGLKQANAGGLPAELGGELLIFGENSGQDGACTFSGQYLGTKTDFQKAKKVLNDYLKNKGVTATSAKADEFDSWVDALTNLMGDLDQPKVYESYYAQSVMDDGTPGYTLDSANKIINAVQAAVGVEGTGNSVSFDLNGPVSATNGAMPNGDAAFSPHRNALFFSQIYSYGFPGFDKPDSQKAAYAKIDAIQSAIRAAKPAGAWTSYVNYIDPRLKNFGQEYYSSSLNRLKSIKKSLDPQTIFDFPQGLAHA